MKQYCRVPLSLLLISRQTSKEQIMISGQVNNNLIHTVSCRKETNPVRVVCTSDTESLVVFLSTDRRTGESVTSSVLLFGRVGATSSLGKRETVKCINEEGDPAWFFLRTGVQVWGRDTPVKSEGCGLETRRVREPQPKTGQKERWRDGPKPERMGKVRLLVCLYNSSLLSGKTGNFSVTWISRSRLFTIDVTRLFLISSVTRISSFSPISSVSSSSPLPSLFY